MDDDSNEEGTGKYFDKNNEYQKFYEEIKFWEKIKFYFRKGGKELLLNSIQLYFVLKEEGTPAWARSVVIGALGYFICPLDVIADFIPVFGFKDDFTIIMAALITLNSYVTEKIKIKAEEKYDELFSFLNKKG